MTLIDSKHPPERTAAIRLLSNRLNSEDLDFVNALLKRLCIEKSLYTKIEIGKALECGGVKTAEQMIKYLGRIGRNQHKCLPQRTSLKKSYPLPRDLVARSLGKMNGEILPVLMNVLKGNDRTKVLEVIDAIGFLLFYNAEYIKKQYFEAVIDVIDKYSKDELVVWKCVRCLSAFQSQKSIDYLIHILNNNQNDIIKCEVKRSLDLIS